MSSLASVAPSPPAPVVTALWENNAENVYAPESMGARVPAIVDVKLLQTTELGGVNIDVAAISQALSDAEARNVRCIDSNSSPRPYGNIPWRTPDQNTYEALLTAWLRLFAMQFNAMQPFGSETEAEKLNVVRQAWRFFRQRTMLLFQRVSEAGVRWIEQCLRNGDPRVPAQLYTMLGDMRAVSPTAAMEQIQSLQQRLAALTDVILDQPRVQDLIRQRDDAKKKLLQLVVGAMMPPIAGVLVPPIRIVDPDMRAELTEVKATNAALARRLAQREPAPDPNVALQQKLLALLGAVGDANWSGRDAFALVAEIGRRMARLAIAAAMPPAILPSITSPLEQQLRTQIAELKRRLASALIAAMMPPVAGVLVPPIRIADPNLRAEIVELKAERDALVKRAKNREPPTDPNAEIQKLLLAALGLVGDVYWAGIDAKTLIAEIRRRLTRLAIAAAMPPASAAAFVPPVRIVDPDMRAEIVELKAERDALVKRAKNREPPTDPNAEIQKLLLAALDATGDANWTGRDAKTLIGEIRRRMTRLAIIAAMPPVFFPSITSPMEQQLRDAIAALRKQLASARIALLMPPLMTGVFVPPIRIADPALRIANEELRAENALYRKRDAARREPPPNPADETHRRLLRALGATDDANWSGRGTSALVDELHARFRRAAIAAGMPPVTMPIVRSPVEQQLRTAYATLQRRFYELLIRALMPPISAILAPPIVNTALERQLQAKVNDLNVLVKLADEQLAKYAKLDATNKILKAEADAAKTQLTEYQKFATKDAEKQRQIADLTTTLTAANNQVKALTNKAAALEVQLEKCHEEARLRGPASSGGSEPRPLARLLVPALMPPISTVLAPPIRIVDKAREQELERANKFLTDANTGLQKALKNAVEIEIQKRAIQKELDDAQKEIRRLKGIVDPEAYAKLQTDYATLQKEANAARLEANKVPDLLRRAREAEAAREAADKKTAEMAAKIEPMGEDPIVTFTNKTKEIERLVAVIAGKERDIALEKARTKQLEGENAALEERIRRELPDVAVRNAELAAAQRKVTEMQAAMRAYDENKLHTENAKLENNLKQKDRELKDALERAKTLESLRRRVDELQGQLAGTQAQLLTSQTQLAGEQRKAAHWQTEYGKEKAAREQVEGLANAFRYQVEALNARLTPKDARALQRASAKRQTAATIHASFPAMPLPDDFQFSG